MDGPGVDPYFGFFHIILFVCVDFNDFSILDLSTVELGGEAVDRQIYFLLFQALAK